MLQRARWAVAGETSYQKWNNETGGIIECSGYDDFKRKYLNIVDKSGNGDTINIGRSLGAKAFTDDVLLPDGSKGTIAEGSKITKVVTFAGKGTGKTVTVANLLEKQYGVKAEEWQKVRGDGYVSCPDGVIRHAELHWFESEQAGRIKMKVKRWF